MILQGRVGWIHDFVCKLGVKNGDKGGRKGGAPAKEKKHNLRCAGVGT